MRTKTELTVPAFTVAIILIIHRLTMLISREGCVMHDWYDISKRLQKKMYEMQLSGKLFGYIWYPICGNWVLYLVKTEDVYQP